MNNSVTLVTFGHAYGRPDNARLTFNLRDLPSPRLANKRFGRTGLDKNLQAEFFEMNGVEEKFHEILEAVAKELSKTSIEADEQDHVFPEGERQAGDENGDPDQSGEHHTDNYLEFAIGCHFGKHRSVAMAERVAVELRKCGVRVQVHHRDLHRSPKEIKINKKDLRRNKDQSALWE